MVRAEKIGSEGFKDESGKEWVQYRKQLSDFISPVVDAEMNSKNIDKTSQ